MQTPDAAHVLRDPETGDVTTSHRWFFKTLLRCKLFGREWLVEVRWRNG